MHHNERPIRILFAEDIPTDVELALHEIRKGGIQFDYRVVDTEEGFRKEITDFTPDLIISDYAMPAFDGMSALLITRSLSRFIPFIMLTGSMNEETAVKCMKAGANDYVIKEQIKRLPFAVMEALEKLQARIEREKIEKQLRESEEKYRNLIDSATDAIVTINEKGEIVSWNKGAEVMFLHHEQEVIGRNVEFIVPETYRNQHAGFVSQAVQSGSMKLRGRTVEFEAVDKKGRLFPIDLSLFSWNSSAGQFFTAIIRDVTQRKRIEKTQQFLYQVSRISLNSVNLSDYLEAIHKELQKVLKADNFYIALYDQQTDKYMLPYHVDEFEDFTNTDSISLKNTLTDYIRKTGEAQLITQEIENRLHQLENIQLVGTRSSVWLGAPLIDSSTSAVIGVIAIQDYANENAYSNDDLNTLKIIAANIGIFIERIKNLQNLRLSEQRFKSFLNSTSDIVQLEDEKGKLLFANKTFINLLDVPDEAIQGKTISELLPPNLAQACETSNKLVRESGKVCTCEEVWGARIFETLKFPIDLGNNKTGIGAFIRDVTEKNTTEKQLKLLSRAVEQNPVSIVITNQDGIIEYVNPTFTAITGYTFEEAKGENPHILKSGVQPHSFYEEMWNTILSGKDWEGQVMNKKKNGELYWESVVISPIVNEKNEITHFVGVKEDITKKKKMLEDLIEAKEKAEESDRLKSAFLANMSHEIRTPMNGILGFTELLTEPRLSGKEKDKYIEIIQKSGNRMLNTVNDIIEISKIETGQVTKTIAPTNVIHVMTDLFYFFSGEADKKGLEFVLDNQDSLNEEWIETDQVKFVSIMTNLIKNAIKYTDQGEIHMGCNRGEKFMEFYVNDTGIGIPNDRQQAIFDRFIQADIADKMALQGSGLGLSISKSYVEMLGGKIRVESTVGQGSTFYFTLPVTKSAPVSQEEEVAEKQDVPTRKLKVLIVEDDESACMYFSIVLEKYARKTLMAHSGNEALDLARNNPDIDLILMDIKMPDMDGATATREIRKFNSTVKIIAQTANALPGDREKALDAGCDDYITKPVNKEKLLEMIYRHTSL